MYISIILDMDHITRQVWQFMDWIYDTHDQSLYSVTAAKLIASGHSQKITGILSFCLEMNTVSNVSGICTINLVLFEHMLLEVCFWVISIVCPITARMIYHIDIKLSIISIDVYDYDVWVCLMYEMLFNYLVWILIFKHCLLALSKMVFITYLDYHIHIGVTTHYVAYPHHMTDIDKSACHRASYLMQIANNYSRITRKLPRIWWFIWVLWQFLHSIIPLQLLC
jgi:hypothetical protein